MNTKAHNTTPRRLSHLTDVLMKEYIQYTKGNLLIIADENTLKIGSAIIDSAMKMNDSSANICMVNIDSYRNGKALKSMPEDLKTLMKSCLNSTDEYSNTSIYLMHGLKDEERKDFRDELMDIITSNGKIGGIPHCSIDVLSKAFHKDNDPKFSDRLYGFMLKEKAVKVKCDKGTTLDIVMDHDKYHLVNSSGVIKPKNWANPIPAEVFAYPLEVNGRLVISGSYSPLMDLEQYKGRFKELVKELSKNPIIMEIKDSEVIDVRCDNPEFEKVARHEVFEIDRIYGKRIGEFGLPANLHVLKNELSGNLLIDEKGRVHIAHGDGYQNRTGCEYQSRVHNDGLISNASIISTRLGQYIMKDNKYNMRLLKK